jgi:hypothetical protein
MAIKFTALAREATDEFFAPVYSEKMTKNYHIYAECVG